LKKEPESAGPWDSGIIIRDTTESDLETIVRLEQDPETAPFILPGTLAQHRADLIRPDLRYLTVCKVDDGRILGFLILILENNCLGLKRMVIGPKGRGYGRAALDVVEKMVRRQNVDRIWLDVFLDNLRARRLYEGAGYRLVQEADFFGRPLLVYEKRLF